MYVNNMLNVITIEYEYNIKNTKLVQITRLEKINTMYFPVKVFLYNTVYIIHFNFCFTSGAIKPITVSILI